MGFEGTEALSTSPPGLSIIKNMKAWPITRLRHPMKRARITITLLAVQAPAAYP